LSTALVNREAAIDGVRILIGSHAHDEAEVTAPVASDPNSVEETMIADRCLIKGYRRLVQECFVECA
jgi:hypothetical protein